MRARDSVAAFDLHRALDIFVTKMPAARRDHIMFYFKNLLKTDSIAARRTQSRD
jgi:hypothetical protein